MAFAMVGLANQGDWGWVGFPVSNCDGLLHVSSISINPCVDWALPGEGRKISVPSSVDELSQGSSWSSMWEPGELPAGKILKGWEYPYHCNFQGIFTFLLAYTHPLEICKKKFKFNVSIKLYIVQWFLPQVMNAELLFPCRRLFL